MYLYQGLLECKKNSKQKKSYFSIIICLKQRSFLQTISSWVWLSIDSLQIFFSIRSLSLCRKIFTDANTLLIILYY